MDISKPVQDRVSLIQQITTPKPVNLDFTSCLYFTNYQKLRCNVLGYWN